VSAAEETQLPALFFSLYPNSLPPICQRNSIQHLRHTMSGRSGHISGGYTHKVTSSHVDYSSERSHSSRGSERRPDTHSRHDRSDYSSERSHASRGSERRPDTHSRHDRSDYSSERSHASKGSERRPDTHGRHDRSDHKSTGRSSSQPTNQVRSSGHTHQSASGQIRPSASGYNQTHGAPRTHSGYPTDNYTGMSRFTSKGGYDNYDVPQDIGRASGVDGRDDYGRDTLRKTRASTKRRPGEGEYSLHVLIYNEGTDNTCCPNSSTVTNAINAFSTTLSSIAGHWALFLGNVRGLGIRIDIWFPNESRTSNDWTNVMTFNSQPRVDMREGYSIDQSTHHPTPHQVAGTVSRQAVRSAAERALQGFNYNAATNNCQTFVLDTLRILVQDGQITQQEFQNVYGRVSNRFAPAHY
jgi:hypothetical protein